MSSYIFKDDKYSSHIKIINYIKNLKNEDLKILDVGCSRGFIGKSLNSANCYGIELNEEDARIAKNFYKSVEVFDIETESSSFNKEFFDIIIMADIIEHLKEPLETVLSFKRLLNKDGTIIISVPNVANIYIRLKLLFGNFTYDEKGILDKTHLKFFTLKSLRKLISDCSLKITKEDYTPVPLPTVSDVFSSGKLLNFLHVINYHVMLIWKKMFAFQFVIYCKKIQILETIKT